LVSVFDDFDFDAEAADVREDACDTVVEFDGEPRADVFGCPECSVR
jgi:hypothetical protein